jgi:hypothetical protein
VLVLIGAGLWHPVRSLTDRRASSRHARRCGHPRASRDWCNGLGRCSAACAATSGNQAIAFGEELGEPHRRMGRMILLAGLIGALATAVPVIAVVIGAVDLPSIQKSRAPFSAFFAAVAGKEAR